MTVEPTLHGERHVLDASALLRLYLADGPLQERLEEAADLLAELQRLPLRTMASMELCPTVLQLTADQQLAGAAGRSGCGGGRELGP